MLWNNLWSNKQPSLHSPLNTSIIFFEKYISEIIFGKDIHYLGQIMEDLVFSRLKNTFLSLSSCIEGREKYRRQCEWYPSWFMNYNWNCRSRMAEGKVVNVNVGGILYTTTLATLTKVNRNTQIQICEYKYIKTNIFD